MKLMKIDKVQPGMVLAKTILNSDFIVILAENTVLTAANISRLGFLDVEELYIKDGYDFTANGAGVQALLNRSNAFASKYTEVLRKVERVFDNVADEGHLEKAKVNELIQSSITPMTYESGAIDYLYKLKNINNSVYNHSLRVALLAGILAKWCHFNQIKRDELILAGLLHDIGKVKLPKKLIEENLENLTETEIKEYQKHTINGYNLLKGQSDLSEGVKMAVLQHHERNDGSGYPYSSKGLDINEYAQLIAVVDLYEHITIERPGFVKRTPFDALHTITQSMFTELSPKFCIPFIENIQQSFLGSKVVLSDKREGTIAFYPNDYAAQPFVKINEDLIIDLNSMPKVHIVEYNPVK